MNFTETEKENIIYCLCILSQKINIQLLNSRLIEELKNYENDKDLDEDNKKTMYLFMGRAYFALGQNKLALKYFTRLRRLDDDTGDFWINRVLDENVN